MKIVLVYKTGGDFDIEYVERLKQSLIGYDVVCLSDDQELIDRIPLQNEYTSHPSFKGWWSKMEMFRPDIIDDDILYFDLDTVIIDDIYNEIQIMSRNKRPIMLSDFYFPERLASGVMYVPKDVRSVIWNAWIDGSISHMESYRGDQEFIVQTIGHMCDRFDFLFPDMICSYKAHVIKEYPNHLDPLKIDPSKSKVICFHGKPRPKDVNFLKESVYFS